MNNGERSWTYARRKPGLRFSHEERSRDAIAQMARRDQADVGNEGRRRRVGYKYIWEARHAG